MAGAQIFIVRMPCIATSFFRVARGSIETATHQKGDGMGHDRGGCTARRHAYCGGTAWARWGCVVGECGSLSIAPAETYLRCSAIQRKQGFCGKRSAGARDRTYDAFLEWRMSGALRMPPVCRFPPSRLRSCVVFPLPRVLSSLFFFCRPERRGRAV